MKDIIQQLLANRLQDFAGLTVQGSIPVSERLVNELAQDFLKTFLAGKPAAPNAAPNAADPSELLRALQVNNFTVHFKEGKMVLEFNLSR